ncbi:MAG TPA: signal peptidase I [Acidimicrobiales bacterium]|jgi:signal peptidase I|nr:signal peptidase I [Acidimicrobiales bacterium]|tara:strand:- start:133 stop:705 length:573 start_codon:yes stop_codon:yes gene_type:complete
MTVTPGDNGENATLNARPLWGSMREWIVVIVLALLAAFALRAVVVQTYFIPSRSMAPTLEVGDRLMVYKLAFRIGQVDRGDLVVFNRPPSVADSQLKDFVKRVIGLPGERVQAIDGVVHIDNVPLRESYLPPNLSTADFGPLVVPNDQIFVMGDNRANSRDSRWFGAVDVDLLVGEVFVRIWPPSSVGRP